MSDSKIETLSNSSESEQEQLQPLVQAILESNVDGILVTDNTGRIVLFNKKFAELLGIREELLSTMDEEQLVHFSFEHLEDPADYLFKVRRLAQQPEAVSGDILHFKNGTILERNSRPQMVQGKCVGRVWNFRDITERKQAEEALEEQNRELIKTNAKLDRFVYGASHELRAPLTSIMGLICIARMGEKDDAQIKILDMMQTSIEQLDIFIKDIVNYSDNSKLGLEREKVDFEEVIEECIEQLRYLPEVERISIFTEVHGDCDFFSDRRRIAVVLNNLLSNAIKYQNSDQGKPFIHIRVRLTPEIANISISDNGAGIALEHQDRIFNMFYRATERKSGTGLGLYIVKEVLERLEGNVRLESVLGKGSTFYVSIPSAKAS
jgi:PAS domain S-box-containing protein